MINTTRYTSLFLKVLLVASSVSACSSVTIRPKGGVKDTSPPSYIDSKPFYFWGLKGQHKVNVNEVCEGAEVSQMQTKVSISDFLYGGLTLGIYAPRTAKVWCEE